MTAPSGLTAGDYFCGAGGSSQGIEAAGGTLVIAANHWQLAVDTHQTNFPDADHDCADISQVDPRRHPRVHVAWFSPECTNHSQAKGKKRSSGQYAMWGEVPDPSAERSRATMWDVVRFTEVHRYLAVVVENVVDVVKWVSWPAWKQAMQDFGYDLHIVSLNSAHTNGEGGLLSAPQSRDRVYVVCVRKGTPIDLELRPTVWCPRCEKLGEGRQAWKPGRSIGKYRQQYVYACSACGTHAEPLVRPAAAAIDWSLLGERIGDRARPLKPATIRRIEAGIAKYGRPMTATVAGNTFERPGHEGLRTRPIDGQLPTVHTTASEALVVPPMVVPLSRSSSEKLPSTVDGPLATQTARQDVAFVVPPMLVPAGGTRNDDATSVDALMRTRTATEAEAIVVPPVEPPGSFIAELRGGGSDSRSTDEPLATVTASGTHHALVLPPGFVMRNNTARSNPGQMCTSLGEPLRTLTTMGHQSLVLLPPHLIVDYYRNGSSRPAATAPIGTVTTLDRHALVDPADLVDDCLFRMLAPHEIGAAMAFSADYVVLGSKRDKVRMYGNAVTPPASALLWARIVEAIGAVVA